MSYRQTYVVEYATENDAPGVSANMECMGGKLVVVQFGDMSEDVRRLEAKIESLLEELA